MTDAAHPFHAVPALARTEGSLDPNLHAAGPVVRLHARTPAVMLRLDSDPAGAADRQTFDFPQSVRLKPGTPPALLAAIWRHLAAMRGPGTTGDPT